MNFNQEKKIIEALEQIQKVSISNTNQFEHFFEEAQNDNHFLDTLFKITMTIENSKEARTGSVLLLLKRLKVFQNLSNQEFLMKNSLDLIQTRIVDAISFYIDQQIIRKTLEEILELLVVKLYPQNWPNLLDLVLTKIKTNDYKEIYGASRVCYAIFKAFNIDIKLNKQTQNFLMEKIFPILENLALKGFNNVTEEFLFILLVINKIFYCTNQLEIQKTIKSENLKIWCLILKNSFEHQFGMNATLTINNWSQMYQLERTLPYKVKNQALKTLVRITQIFANKPNFYEDLLSCFQKIIPSILDSGLNCLVNHLQKQYFYSSFYISEIYKLLFYSIQINYKSFEFMNGNLLRRIIFDIAIYHMQISKFEEDLFGENITQYIYSEKNIQNEPVMMNKQCAADILYIIFKNDEQFVKEYLEFANEIMKGNNIRTQNKADERLQEAILFGLETCISVIRVDLKSKMDMFIEKLILPALSSQNIFLKARACSILSQLTDCEINQMNLIISLCKNICECLTTKNLFLRIKSINALCLILTIEETHQYMKKDLPIILQTIFQTMKEINIEDLSESLKIIVQEFQDSIQPFAIELTSNLLSNFWEIAKNKELGEDADEIGEQFDLLDSLESSLITIGDILGCDLNQEFYLNSINWVSDLMAYLLTNKITFDFMDHTLELFSVFIYQIQNYNDQIYFFFPIICYTIIGKPKTPLNQNLPNLTTSQMKLMQSEFGIQQEHVNHFDNYISILGNFIQKGHDIIFNGSDFYSKTLLEYIFDIVDFLTERGLKDNIDLDLLYAIKILSFLFENNFEYLINKHIVIFEVICKYYKNYLDQNRGSLLKSTVYQKFCQMLFLNAQISLQTWKKLNMYDNIIYGIFGNLHLFQDVDEKENFVMGLIGLYKLPSNQFPNIIPLPSLVKETLSSLMFLVQKNETEENFKEEDVEVSEDEKELSQDRSWNEEEYIEFEELNYDSPFEQLNVVNELQKSKFG